MQKHNGDDVEDQIVSAEATGNPTQPPSEQTPLLKDAVDANKAADDRPAVQRQLSTAKLVIIIGSSLVRQTRLTLFS